MLFLHTVAFHIYIYISFLLIKKKKKYEYFFINALDKSVKNDHFRLSETVFGSGIGGW